MAKSSFCVVYLSKHYPCLFEKKLAMIYAMSIFEILFLLHYSFVYEHISNIFLSANRSAHGDQKKINVPPPPVFFDTQGLGGRLERPTIGARLL
jgi:hypothetical protein